MYCPKCGFSNNTDAKFCGSCGNALSTQQEPTIINNINQNQQVEQLEPIPAVESQIPNIQQQNITQQSVNNISQQQYVMQSQNLNSTPKKSNKKLLIAVIAMIIIIVVVFAVITLLSSGGKSEEERIDEAFNQEQLIKVKNNNKYGYIDTTGKFVLKANYEEASDFKGKYAVVRSQVNQNGVTVDRYQIIDKKGTVKLTSETSIEYIDEQDVWISDYSLYNSSLKKLNDDQTRVKHLEDNYFIWVNSEKNTGGIMNEKGKITYTYTFQEDEDNIDVEPSNIDDTLKERYCVINIENDKYSIVNCDTGKVVYDFTDKYIQEDEDNIFEIKDHETYKKIGYVYIQGDKVAYEATGSSITLTYYSRGYISIRDRDKPYTDRYTYFDTKTEKVSKEMPEYSDTEEEEINDWEEFTKNKKFNCGSSYGLMNNDKVTLPCEWDSLEYVETELYKYLSSKNKKYIYGKKDSKWYLIDINTQKPIIEFNTSYINQEESSPFMYYTDKETDNKKVYSLITNKTLTVEEKYSETNLYSNYITVRNSDSKTIKYYNNALELIYTEDM